jgi:AdoMet-dependent heme synthase
MPPTTALDGRLVVVWRITEACDLGCAYCGYGRDLLRPRAEADPGAVLAWGRVLRDYAQAAGREVMVSWLGGEPLRWPPLLEVAQVFRREYQLSLSVTTNGTALSSERVRRQLTRDFSELVLSLDGPPAWHDTLRQAPGLNRRLRANIQQVRELKEREGSKLRLGVNTVLMRENVSEFEALCQTAAEWGIETLTFNGLGGRDRPEFFPDHRLLPKQVAWLRDALPGIRARMARLGLTICGSEPYLERLAASAAGQALPIGVDEGGQGCRAGDSFLFVDEQGRVSPCSYTSEAYGYRLATLQTPEAVRTLPARWAADRQRHPAAACADCLSTQVFGKFWYS